MTNKKTSKKIPGFDDLLGESRILPLIRDFVFCDNCVYPVKTNLWENWFPFAWLAFKKIPRKEVKSFATIGTGSGLDAVGASNIFSLDTLVLTEVSDKVSLDVAESNEALRLSNALAYRHFLTGSLCSPLREKGIKVDLIYENLPNIPSLKRKVGGPHQDSQYQSGSFSVSYDHIKPGLLTSLKAYLLESHLALLLDARASLNPGGSVICSIGGRVPYHLLQDMVRSAGYTFHELVAGFKVQTEPEEVLPGYARAEAHGVTFDFYQYDAAVCPLRHYFGLKEPYIDFNGRMLKRLLAPRRISAHEALRNYRLDPSYLIGHTVHMIQARKKEYRE